MVRPQDIPVSARSDVLGVLGGMGPAATADFLAKLTKATRATRDQDHLSSVICCLPDIPDRTAAILDNGPSPLPALRKSLELLRRSGATRIAIPCNTAHHWFDDLQDESALPIIHIVDAVKNALLKRKLLDRPVGLLATTATIYSAVYRDRLWADRVSCLAPVEQDQRCLMDVIRSIKAGEPEQVRNAQKIRRVIGNLARRGAGSHILACTELPLILPALGDDLIDSTEALAQECVNAWRQAAANCTKALRRDN
jgi:aspartate racemase